MFDALAVLHARPEPFSAYTADVLWTDPHIAARMLAFHLDPEGGLASRPFAVIDAMVDWMDARLGLAGAAVCDLGCGPGLYAERLAGRGARVTGLDFSAGSIAHAKKSAAAAGLAVDYRTADYLKDPLPENQDAVLLIYGDFCALSPQRRAALLGRIHAALRPGGRLLFDVFSRPQFEGRTESVEFARRLMDGFWAPGDYFGFRATFLYDELSLALDRYRIVEPGRTRDIFNWLHYFTPEAAIAEAESAGFNVEGILEACDGTDWKGGPSEIAVIARRP